LPHQLVGAYFNVLIELIDNVVNAIQLRRYLLVDKNASKTEPGHQNHNDADKQDPASSKKDKAGLGF